ncbi:hypothetical protein RA264_27995, partial [Pseudomonas syringae pv. tagetis]|uniref:hypothetical protein n=1 Tax=Pseudomonas syringae group genomosp. 7 TaxID=251699 RepID=UPI00376FA412
GVFGGCFWWGLVCWGGWCVCCVVFGFCWGGCWCGFLVDCVGGVVFFCWVLLWFCGFGGCGGVWGVFGGVGEWGGGDGVWFGLGSGQGEKVDVRVPLTLQDSLQIHQRV